VPLPSAPWLVAAGALSASGELNPLFAIATAAVACVIADSLWFYLGRRGGQRLLRWFSGRPLHPNSWVERTRALVGRHGQHGLVAAKFLPGFGMIAPPLAGALGMSAARFLFLDTLGSLFYGTFYIAAGLLFADQLQQVLAVLSQIGLSTLLLAMVL